jgi:hypothetical protein
MISWKNSGKIRNYLDETRTSNFLRYRPYFVFAVLLHMNRFPPSFRTYILRKDTLISRSHSHCCRRLCHLLFFSTPRNKTQKSATKTPFIISLSRTQGSQLYTWRGVILYLLYICIFFKLWQLHHIQRRQQVQNTSKLKKGSQNMSNPIRTLSLMWRRKNHFWGSLGRRN